MPQLTKANPTTIIKLLLIGDSSTGKTGALASLVKEGYMLHVLDFDNKIAGGILPLVLQRDCPDKIGNVDFEVLRDKLKSSALGPIPDGVATAFTKGLALLDNWSDRSKPSEWGEKHILVVDSLTFLSDAAFAWARSMNPSAKDPRQWFYTAQQAVEGTIAMLTAEAFRTNVVVISHVSWQERPDGTMKGYPATVGKALGPTIPAYFECMAHTHIINGKRVIQTTPTALIDLKNPAAFKMLPTLPIETGLADFFRTMKGEYMARKPDEITIASLQEYLDDLQGEFNELKEQNEGEEDEVRDEKLEALEMRMDSVIAAIEAINDVE